MNAFDGLLPPPRTAPPLPERGGPAAVKAAAKQRKLRRATTTVTTSGMLSLALLAFSALTPPDGTHGVETDPTATRPPAVTASGSHSPGTDSGAGPPPSAGASHSTGGPGGGGTHGAGGAGATDATAGLSGGPSTPPVVTTEPPPDTRPTRYTRIDRDDVADKPAEPCRVRTAVPVPSQSLCVRYLGPAATRSGKPTDLAFEFCAKTVDVRVSFESRQEVRFLLLSSGSSQETWMGVVAPGGGPHTETIRRGRCLRYTAHWDGLGSDGTAPAPGAYEISGWLLDDISDTEVAPEADQLVIT